MIVGRALDFAMGTAGCMGDAGVVSIVIESFGLRMDRAAIVSNYDERLALDVLLGKCRNGSSRSGTRKTKVSESVTLVPQECNLRVV